MTNKKLKKLAIGIAVVVTPVIASAVVDGVRTSAMASIRRAAGAVTSMFRSSSSTSSSSVRSAQNTRARGPLFSGTDKVLAVVGAGVATVGVVGTTVGLALTEDQYQQSKRSFEDVVDRTYNAFYEDREKQLKDLYDKWGVPMPDKYKNPFKNEGTNSKPTPGFSFGGGN